MRELKALGEKKVEFLPPHENYGGEDVFVKGFNPWHEEWVSGSAYREKDGSITVLNDMLMYQRPGYKISDLGICDPRCWCVNINSQEEREKRRLSARLRRLKDEFGV